MKIQCQNCGVEHEIAPPSWVVSSGRAFRFRCSSCGYSQSVHPSTLVADAGEPPEIPPIEEAITSIPPFSRSDDAPVLAPPEEPIAEPTEDPEPGPFETDSVSISVDDATPSSGGEASAVFLKQNGQIYMVSDWSTLKRWIAESRVERHDLVSEGGVRWEPVGNRPELITAFGGAAPAISPFPFGGETPFGDGGSGNLGWHDDDTEGVPTGLPPLPTDEVPASNARGFDALDARLRKMTPTPPPVARRAPPPQRPSFLTPTPMPRIEPMYTPAPMVQPAPEPKPEAPDIAPPEMMIAPPALPDTVPPAPQRNHPVAADLQPTQPGAFPRGALKPKAFQMADAASEQEVDELDELEVFEEISDIQPMPPLEYETTDTVVVRTSPWVYIGILIGLAAVFVLFFAGAVWLSRPTHVPTPIPSLPLAAPSQPLPPTPSAPSPSAVPAVPEPITPTPTPPTPTEPSPVAPTPVAPRPVAPTPIAPKPVAPTQPRPAGPSVAMLVDRGWSQVEGNPKGALANFKAALAKAPNNADANFGYGYALVKTGSPSKAQPYLCKAASRGSLDTRREARGTLARAGLVCE